MNKRFLAVRLTVAALIGLAVFALSLLSVWRASPGTLMKNTMIHSWSVGSLVRVDRLIQEHIEQKETPPVSLREVTPHLSDRTFPRSNAKAVREGLPVDGWGRALLYSVQGTSYTLLSYGRDGRPGGDGFDRDIDSSDDTTFYLDYSAPIWSDPPMPSLRQFLFELPSGGMVLCCALSGMIAFLASAFLIRTGKVTMEYVCVRCMQVFLTMVLTVFFAMMIMQLHIPTSH